jgi:trk system potassium uptake protein TrkA
MKIIIAGAGEVGTHLAKLLSRENQEIVLLDENSKKLDAVAANYDILPIAGKATSLNDLEECGVKDADLFIAVTPSESVNMTACMLATNLGAVTTLARIDNYEYLLPKNKEFFNKLGVDSLIYPEMLAAKEIVDALKNSWQRVNMSFGGNALVLLGIKIRANAPVANQQFQTRFLDHARFRVVAIKRKNETIIPKGTDQIIDGDIVFFITKNENIEFTREQAGKLNRPIKNVMIMGGSRIGVKTIQYLPEKVNVKVLEVDYDKCMQISDATKGKLVINGDGRDLELLKQEGIQEMDAFVAVTGNSEANILACLAAKRFGVIKTIAEIENFDYIPLAQNLDIGTIINKKLIAASHIYQLTLDANVLNVKCLQSSDAQIVEFVAKPGSKVTKNKLRDLKLPPDVNFGGFIRNGEGHICSGDTVILPDDHVIVFCLSEGMRNIESFF